MGRFLCGCLLRSAFVHSILPGDDGGGVAVGVVLGKESSDSEVSERMGERLSMKGTAMVSGKAMLLPS